MKTETRTSQSGVTVTLYGSENMDFSQINVDDDLEEVDDVRQFALEHLGGEKIRAVILEPDLDFRPARVFLSVDEESATAEIVITLHSEKLLSAALDEGGVFVDGALSEVVRVGDDIHSAVSRWFTRFGIDVSCFCVNLEP